MKYDYKLKQLMNKFLKYISNTLTISDNLRMSDSFNNSYTIVYQISINYKGDTPNFSGLFNIKLNNFPTSSF